MHAPQSVMWWMRWTNTILVTVLSPLCFVGTVYLLLFFILNSSYGPKILHGQLGAFLRGDYFAETMRTDALLRDLTMTNVRLSEAGKSDAIVFAPRVVAKIPVEELVDLITDTTLRVGRIHAYDAEVTLDFSQGELNILKVVLPYFSDPTPPDPIPGNFVTFLEDLNVSHSVVHLIFDGFRIDLSDVDVDHYAIRAGAVLSMYSPKASNNGGLRAIRAGKTVLTFNPSLFGFPLSDIGPKNEGLIFSGGTGISGKLGYSYESVAHVLAQIVENASENTREMPFDTSSPKRGNFIVQLENTLIEAFQWQGSTMFIPAMDTSIGNGGQLSLRNGMMNTAPTHDDIEKMTHDTGHKPSGLLPEESLLWEAKIDLRLGVEDDILAYFFGPILYGDMPFRLIADMRGDLARVSGDISLDMPEFETFETDILRASLHAHMDGQHVDISAFEADTNFGAIAVKGFYEIFDGNFSVDAWLGDVPKNDAFPYIDKDFADRLGDGMIPIEFLPDGVIKRFSGTLRSHLHAESNDGEIRLSMPKTLNYSFDETIFGIKKVTIAPVSKESDIILTYKDGRITSPAGLNIDTGKDFVRVAPHLQLDLTHLDQTDANIKIHIDKPSYYTDFFGISGFNSDAFDLDIAYESCDSKRCGHIIAKSGNMAYAGFDIPRLAIDLQIAQSKLNTRQFAIDTHMGNIRGNIRAEIPQNILSEPLKFPFDAQMRFQNIDFSKLPVEAAQSLGLQGVGRGVLRVTGPADRLKANLHFSADDLHAYDIDVSRLSLHAGYENDQLFVSSLNVWFADATANPAQTPNSSEFHGAPNRALTAANNTSESENENKENRQTPTSLHANPTAKETQTLSPNDAIVQDDSTRESVSPNHAAPSALPSNRRTPDFALTALTYDIPKNTVVFNVALQPISPSDFKPFRDLNLPLSGTVAFDLAINADIDRLLAMINDGNAKSKSFDATWIEGDIHLNQIQYDGLNLGNTQIQFSRSSQFALVRGDIIDLLDLSGFVRTAPKLTSSISLNFPNLDILKALDGIGIDISGIKESFNLRQASVSGSIGFCMKSFSDMQISVLLDDIAMSVFGYPLSLTQPAFIRADLNKMQVSISQLEFKYRDSILKLSGNGDLHGNVDIDINGEIDAALARSFVGSVEQSSGLLGINLSAHGNIYDHGAISLKHMDIQGYLGVRDPIQIKTELSASPFEVSKGFILIGNQHPLCSKREICVYTPDEQPFTFGINDQWLTLSLFAGALGYTNVQVGGKIDAAIAQLFVKDISMAQGIIDLNAQASGRFLDKAGALSIPPNQLDIEGHVAVESPVTIEMRSLNDPITVEDGILKIADGDECPSHKSCIVIPENRAFSGNLMGGTYRLTGEIVRDVLVPKSGYLSATASNVGFRMKDELSLTLSPDIQITVKDFSNFETIKVSGDIDIAEATYKKNFDDGSSNFIKEQILSMFVDSRRRVATYSPSFLRKMPELAKIQFDIGVVADNSIGVDVKIAGATVELELGAQARIGGTITDIAPTGIFSINSGLFSMNDNDFDFQSGSQIAFNGSLDGKIDITASAEINTESNAFGAVTGNTDLDRRKRISSTSSNAASDLYAITLTVGGTLFQPNWSFDSSPYLSDANIYALILTGKTIEDFSGNDIAMESLLSPLFASQLDSFIDADQFKFLFSEGAAQFVYVKQITKALRIAAGVSIRGSEGNEQALSGEYYFNDNWFVDLTGQNTSDEEGRAPTFKLGARLHWHLGL